MKKITLITAMIFVLLALRLDARPEIGVSFNFFYSSLRPYGEWIHLDNDLVVWRPNGIHKNWRPYMEGRWCWTNDGWYWDSYEPFGWATYHYGRWYDDEYYGWIWVPDYDWGPSWVEWRYDDDYIGWAPLPPYASFHINFGIRFSIGWHSHYKYWNFVSYNRFCDRRLNYYLLDERRSERIFGGTKYRTNYYSDHDRIINGGVDRAFIERKAGYRITEREISRVDNANDFNRFRNERGDRVIAYRPSDGEVGNARTDERFEIKRGDDRTSLDRSKVQTRMNSDIERTVTTDRNIERTRDMNSNREINREENTRSREIVREQSKVESPRIQTPSENRATRNDGRANREIQRERPQMSERIDRSERPQVLDRPNRSERSNQIERPSQSERKQEIQRTPKVERSTPRTERSSRNESRGEKQSERSAERRR